MVFNMDRHLDDADAERYSMGAIPEDKVTWIEEHLLICEGCQQRVLANDHYAQCMRRATAELKKARPPKRLPAVPGRALVLALGATMGLLSGVWMVGHVPAQRTAGSYAVDLQATRGAGLEAQAPANRPLALHLDSSGLPSWPSYRVEIVDGLGNRVWHGGLPGAAVTPMPAGRYFVRAYSPSGELLREYALQVVSSR